MRSLELSIDIDTVYTPALFASIVSTATASTPNLEILTLSLADRPAYSHTHHWDPPDGVSWPQLWHDIDATIMRLRAAALRKVFFSLRYFMCEPERFDAFVVHVKSKLPRAVAAGLIVFTHRPSVIMAHPMDCFVDE
jgi:hypothetical protein